MVIPLPLLNFNNITCSHVERYICNACPDRRTLQSSTLILSRPTSDQVQTIYCIEPVYKQWPPPTFSNLQRSPHQLCQTTWLPPTLFSRIKAYSGGMAKLQTTRKPARCGKKVSSPRRIDTRTTDHQPVHMWYSIPCVSHVVTLCCICDIRHGVESRATIIPSHGDPRESTRILEQVINR